MACDKPPVGTLAALLEHNQPAIIMSDGAIHPGTDPNTGEKLDIVSAYQVAGNPDAEYRHHIACHACPGYGSCGGMFTYNTMQTFIGVVGMQPLHMVAPPSDDPRRLKEFPDQLVEYLAQMIAKGLKPRDIVVRNSIRNAVIVAMAIGGSTNVTLHAPEIARAAGFADFWKEVMTPAEFNHLSQYVVPVLTDARPLRQIFDGRHRPGRRRAGDRPRTAGSRAAQWRRDDLHRRNAGRSRSSVSAPSPSTAR